MIMIMNAIAPPMAPKISFFFWMLLRSFLDCWSAWAPLAVQSALLDLACSLPHLFSAPREKPTERPPTEFPGGSPVRKEAAPGALSTLANSCGFPLPASGTGFPPNPRQKRRGGKRRSAPLGPGGPAGG